MVHAVWLAGVNTGCNVAVSHIDTVAAMGRKGPGSVGDTLAGHGSREPQCRGLVDGSTVEMTQSGGTQCAADGQVKDEDGFIRS